MGTVMHCYAYRPQLRFPSFGIILCLSSEVSVSRQQVLKQVDKELAKGDERAALTLVKDLQGKPGGLRCFGAARQVNFTYILYHSLKVYDLIPFLNGLTV